MQGDTTPQPTIYIVDGDPAVRDSLCSLLTLYGYRVEACGTAAEFLARRPLVANACLVSEFHLPDMTGLELLRHLRGRAPDLPVIFIANRSDVPTAVRAIRSGAVDYLEKPFLDRALLQRIRELLDTRLPERASGRG